MNSTVFAHPCSASKEEVQRWASFVNEFFVALRRLATGTQAWAGHWETGELSESPRHGGYLWENHRGFLYGLHTVGSYVTECLGQLHNPCFVPVPCLIL